MSLGKKGMGLRALEKERKEGESEIHVTGCDSIEL